VNKKAFVRLRLAALFTIGLVQPFNAQLQYPWVYPGNFRERVKHADLVASGMIRSTVSGATRVVDGVNLTSNHTTIEIDRIFKGHASERRLRFLWFSPAPVKGGVLYSGPPLAKFVTGQRVMVFLSKGVTGYTVGMPLYQIEVPLAPASPLDVSNVSVLPDKIRDSEIARELESAALSIGPPAPGTTGLAATYFPHVVDLIGGCAKPFLQHYTASQSKELRDAAQGWVTLIMRKHMDCQMPIHP